MYSLRNLPLESNLPIGYDAPFYLLAYTLPYENEEGFKSWCEVGTNGKSVEEWGTKYGLEHYVVFLFEFW